MNLSSITGGRPVITNPLAPVTTTATGRISDAPVPRDGVSLSGAPGQSEVAAAPQTPQGLGQRSLLRSAVVGLCLATSMIGLAGCSTMQMDTRMLPNIQQNVTGSEAKSAFGSISYLDSVASKSGGGIFNGSATPEHHLQPLAAVRLMMDGHELNYQAKSGDKPHPIRSWAELKGLEDQVRQQQGGSGPIQQH